LGILLYEMAALRLPFTGDSVQVVCQNVLRKGFDPIPIHYSSQLKDLVKNCLCKKDALRPSTEDILASPFLQIYIEKNKANM
jgi:serine/threonine protein kinase